MPDQRDPKPGEVWHTRAMGLVGRRLKVCAIEPVPGYGVVVVVRSYGLRRPRKSRIRIDRFHRDFVREEA